MNKPSDLRYMSISTADLGVLNTGTLRHRFRKHYVKTKHRNQPSRAIKWCDKCRKRGYTSQAAARYYIVKALYCGGLDAEDSFAINPYECPHNEGMWHIGRNRRAIRMFADLFKKLPARAPATTEAA